MTMEPVVAAIQNSKEATGWKEPFSQVKTQNFGLRQTPGYYRAI